MDLPPCATLRQTGTVIVRIKMEVNSCHAESRSCAPHHHPTVVHRPSGCEQCSRTRLVSQYSDCDSGLVGRCRPYRLTSARSRYVYFCAAVCLLLLAASSFPCSSAAPYRRRTMDRQRRAADTDTDPFENPCSYADSNSNLTYDSKYAKHIANQAISALHQVETYKDKVAKLYSFDSFAELLKGPNEVWLDNASLPANKVLGQKVPEEDVKSLVADIDTKLPMMYRDLQAVYAGLHNLSGVLNNDGIGSDAELGQNINVSANEVKAVLCCFYDLMKARKITMLPFSNSGSYSVTIDNYLNNSFGIYRDTLNYLEYLNQVFDYMGNQN